MEVEEGREVGCIDGCIEGRPVGSPGNTLLGLVGDEQLLGVAEVTTLVVVSNDVEGLVP